VKVLQVVVVEDSRPRRAAVKAVLEAFPDVVVSGEAAVSAAPAAVERLKPDLLVVGVSSRGSGLDMVRHLGRHLRPPVVFVADADDHALAAIELDAVDYLLRPLRPPRVREALDRAWERLRTSSGPGGGAGRLERLPVKSGDGILLIPVELVASLIAEGEILHVTTVRNEHHVLSSYRLKELEPRLQAEGFVRLSRSALANLRHLSRISPLPGGTYLAVMVNQQEIPVSRSQSRRLRERLLRL
jgi:two-component system, LytTR family, response regulator